MRELLVAASRLLALSWAQSRPKTALAVGLMLAGGATVPVAALGLRSMLNAALVGEAGTAVVSAVLVAALLIGSLTFSHFAHVAYFELAELNVLRYDERLIGLANGAPTLAIQEREDHADRLTVLDQEVQQTRAALQALLSAGGLAVGMVLTSVILAVLHPVLLLLPLLAVPPLLISRRAEQVVDRARTAAAGPTRQARNLFQLATGVGPAKELRVFGLRQQLRERHAAQWRRSAEIQGWAQVRASLLRAAGQLVFVAGYVAAVLLVLRQTVAGQHTVGDVILMIVLAAQVNAQVAGAVALLPDLQRISGVDRRLRELRAAVATDPSAGSADHTAVPERMRDGITLRGVTFAYPGTDRPVLDGVELRLPAGATVAVVGENGAGKSSLVKLLCGLYQPTSGEIRVDGVDLRQLSPAQWRARVAAGFQDFVRYEFLVRETVGLGDLPRIDSAETVAEAVRRADADAVVARLPDGLDTQLGKSHAPGVELSGGQWQRLALGRALMRQRPLLLMLDEPTAALDADAEHALFERYAAQARQVGEVTGAVTVLVSHRFSTVRMADLIVVMADGRVAEVGDHATLMRNDGLYAELYSLQAQAYQ